MPSAVYRQIGQRVRQAREAIHLSQEEVARALGYNSPATISYYESGERKLSIVDLQRLATILHVPLGYFFDEEPPLPPSLIQLRAGFVRPEARKPLAEFVLYAQRHRRTSPALPHVRGSRPGDVAETLLNDLEIAAPPVSPRAIAAALDVPVYDWTFPDEISGLVVVDTDLACIGVNQQHAHVRQRFTVAHELGHLMFRDNQSVFVDFSGDAAMAAEVETRHASQETTANRFAASLLMPSAWIRDDVAQHGQDVAFLARRYEVSEQALWFRLVSLHLVTMVEGGLA